VALKVSHLLKVFLQTSEEENEVLDTADMSSLFFSMSSNVLCKFGHKQISFVFHPLDGVTRVVSLTLSPFLSTLHLRRFFML